MDDDGGDSEEIFENNLRFFTFKGEYLKTQSKEGGSSVQYC